MPAVLFVTRKFPPSVGGMETLAADVWASLHEAVPASARLVAHGGSAWGLPAFVLRALCSTNRSVRRDGADVVLAGDVVMFMLLAPLARILHVRLVPMAHGKDIVWGAPGYRALVRRMLPHAGLVLANSAATASQAIAHGVPADRVEVVRLGIEVPPPGPDGRDARAELRRSLGMPADAMVVAILGRLVRRKGVAWFLREVVPALPDGVVVVVAGDGEDAPAVRAAAAALPSRSRVVVLGRVDAAMRELVMTGGDLFVQPNIPVANDMEGFGLVAVEAAMRGSLVLAADLEGLKDAVLPGVTGELLPAGDAGAWATRITALLDDRDGLRVLAAGYAAAARREFSRAQMGVRLCSLLGLTP